MTQVKICGIGSIEEGMLAIQLGASALGLVSEMPSGPGMISESSIARIAASWSTTTCATWIGEGQSRPPPSVLGVNRLVFPELVAEIEAVGSVPSACRGPELTTAYGIRVR